LLQRKRRGKHKPFGEHFIHETESCNLTSEGGYAGLARNIQADRNVSSEY
jgi:hypothetical protein